MSKQRRTADDFRRDMAAKVSDLQSRKRIRRVALAEHFAVNVRTIDAWAKRGVIPKPHYLNGSGIPFWFMDEIEGLRS